MESSSNSLLLTLMKIFRYIFYIAWRVWFYCWVLGTIIGALPILIVVISTDKLYPYFFRVGRAWSRTILFVMGFKVKIEYEQEMEKGKSYMLSANHTSMIDIMVMFLTTKNPFVFVGKKELAKIPLFGSIYKRTCILVDRDNPQSRKAVFDEANKRLKSGLSVCIFPEGLVPDDESIVLAPFKNGAFRLAIEHQIPLIPMSFYDCKKRFSYNFFSGGPGVLRVKVHPFLETEGLTKKDIEPLKKQTFELIYKDLVLDQQKEKNG